MIELLEQRTLLTGSPYTPLATVADSNNTSDNNLRSAITAANADTTADTINLTAGTYALTLGELDFDPTTAHSLTIVGNASSGPNATIIDQLSLDRVFQIAAGDSVTFQNLEITGGVATDFPGKSSGIAGGGGIFSAGDLTLTNVVVTGNKAIGPSSGSSAAGGGIAALAGLTIQNSVISDNSVLAGPGTGQTNDFGYGGGIFLNSSSAVSVTDTLIANNTSLGGTAGGGGLGGGVYVSDAAGTTTKFTDDTITGNQAVGGSEGGDGAGGGLEFDTGSFNSAATGATTTVQGCTISYNTATAAAADAPSGSPGGDAFGGGVEVYITGTQFLNDTVYGNSAVGGAGVSGLAAGNAYGGGIDDDTTTEGTGGVSIVNCTVVANSSQSGAAPAGSTAGTGQGGGIANNSLNADSHLTIENTLDAENTASSESSGPDVFGAAATTLDNLIGDGTGASGFSGNGNQVGSTGSPINPLLGPLVDNGGATDTLALGSGSPAIATGSLSAANSFGLSTDQRGLPFDSSASGKVDIGAFDVQSTPLPTVTLAPIAGTASLGTSLTLTATVSQTSGNTKPSGTVTFLDKLGGITNTLGTATLSSGVATMTVLALPQGSNGITAVYSGDTNFNGNTSAAQTQAVTLASGEALTASPNVADGLAGSLRAAIATANADTANATDVIVLGAGTYDLTGGALEINPTTAHTIIIEGQGSSGPNATIISEQTIDRVFQIFAGSSVTFENLEITGGLADTDDTGSSTNVSLGGGILDGGNPGTANNSTLTLTGVTVSNNKSVALSNTGIGADGGGVLSTGTLIINGSSAIEGNSAIAALGGTADTADNGNAAGGGIYDLTGGNITQSTIAYNAVLAGAGANGAAGTSGGTSSAANGSAGQAGGQASGGGLYFGSSTAATVAVQQNAFTGNIVVGGAGGTGGTAASGGTDGNGGDGGTSDGAGAYLITDSSGTLTASGNTISNNTAEAGAPGGVVANDATAGDGGDVFGAGLYAIAQAPGTGVTSGIVTINSNTVSGNTIQAGEDSPAEGGGAFVGNGGNSQLQFNSNTVTGNTIENDTLGGLFGGGLYVANSGTSTASFQINDDTLENNTLTGDGASTAKGGGAYIDNAGGSPIVFNDGTISNNAAEVGDDGDASGGGLFATIESAATSTATFGMDQDTLQDNIVQATANSSSSAQGGGLSVDDEGPASANLDDVSLLGNTANIAANSSATGGSGNAAQGAGGYINNTGTGTVTITASTIGNTNAGNIAEANSGSYAFGGGLFVTGTSPVQITSTTLSSNSAVGGAGIAGASGTAGGAGGDGIAGAIYLTNGGTTADQLTNDKIISNTATGGAGGAGGSGAGGGAGGAVYGGGMVAAQNTGTTQGPVTITDSLIANNTATAGNGGSGTAGNAGAGGSVGGGGFVTGLKGTLLENDTVYGNLAQGGSGQTSGNVYGAGIDDTNAGGLSIINVTVASNTAKLAAPVSGGTAGTVGGGGIANDPTFGSTDSKLLIENTLDANNNAENASGTNVATAGEDIDGPTETTVSNLFGNYNATAAPGITTANGNQLGPSTGVTPGLASSLADNGGPTESLALLPSSTALGAGNVADAAGTTDQRGDPRVVNGKVDIGALETQPGPTVTASGTINTYHIGVGPAVAVDAGMTVSSTDAQLTGATLTISSGTLQTGDTLNFTNQNGITGNYAGGVLTLTGTATPTQYQAALDSVTFSTTSTSKTTRAISVVVDDNSQTSSPASESVEAAFPPPVVTPSGKVITYIVGSAPEVVDSGLEVTSADTDLTGATLTISAGTLQSGDSLSFTNQFGISSTYSNGVLTLSGTASVTFYQSALGSVLFSTTSTNSSPRSISVVAIDGTTDSAPAAETVDVVVPPTLKASGTVNSFSIGGTPVPVDSGLTVSGGTSDLTGATVTISSSVLQTGDSLNFTNQNGITGNYSDGVLTLTGSATVAQYQTALDSVTFSTTSSTTTTRAISVVVSQGSLKSATLDESVQVAASLPSVSPSGKTNTFVLGGSAVAVDSGVTVGPTGTELTGAILTISAGTLQSGDTLNFTSQNGITGSYSSGTGELTLTGTATAAQYQTALQSITFSTTSANTTARQIAVNATDDTLNSNFAAETVDVSIANASLSGTAFDDVNQNDTLDSGEPLLANISITLTGTDSEGNSVDQTTLTSSSGTYSFTQLVAGTYTLTATLPTDLAGGQAVDSNSSSLGSASGLVIGAIDLASGASQTGFNFTASGLAQTYYNVNMFLASSPPLTELLNEDPVVSSLSDQATTEATATTPQSFTVADPYVPVANLTVSGASSNATLVPTANIVYGGSGADRTVTVTPAAGQTGTATITTTVTDPFGNLAQEAFTVTVAASAASSSAVVSPLVSNASNQSPSGDAAGDDATGSPAVSPAASGSSSSTGSVSPVAKNSSAVDAALASEDAWT